MADYITYKVGDTDYRFPSDMPEAQVQSILTSQGIIKPKAKDIFEARQQMWDAENARVEAEKEAKSKPIPLTELRTKEGVPLIGGQQPWGANAPTREQAKQAEPTMNWGFRDTREAGPGE